MSVRLGFAEGPAGHVAVEAELAAFLGRLMRWDKAAVVRLRSAEGEPALGVFGHPPFGGVLAVQSLALRGDAMAVAVDATVSAGELLDAVAVAAQGAEFTLPPSVTGSRLGRSAAAARRLAAAGRFRRGLGADGGGAGGGRVPAAHRGAGARAAHPGGAGRAGRGAVAAAAARERVRGDAAGGARGARAGFPARADRRRPGFPGRLAPRSGTATAIRPRSRNRSRTANRWRTEAEGRPGAEAEARSEAEARAEVESVAVLAAGPWLRLRTAYGSVAVRDASAASGLTVSPT